MLLLTLFGTVCGTPCQLAAARIYFIVVCPLGERTLARPPEHSFCVLLATLRFPLHLRQQKLRPVALLGHAVLVELPLSPGGVALSLRMMRCGSRNATPLRHRGRNRLIFTRLTNTTTTDVLSVRKEGCAAAALVAFQCGKVRSPRA